MSSSNIDLLSHFAVGCSLSAMLADTTELSSHSISLVDGVRDTVIATKLEMSKVGVKQGGATSTSKDDRHEIMCTTLSSSIPDSSADHGVPTNTTGVDLVEFTVFPNLPAELKIKIIEATIPSWQFVKVKLGICGGPGAPRFHFHSTTQVPPILHVNSEFREIASRHYQKQSTDHWLANTYANFESTILELSDLNSLSLCLAGENESSELLGKLVKCPEVQRLVLRSTILWDDRCSWKTPEKKICLKNIVRSFPTLRELWVEYELGGYCGSESAKNNEKVMVDVEACPYLHPRALEMNQSFQAELKALRKQSPNSKLQTIRFVSWAINDKLPADDEFCLDMGKVTDINDTGLFTMEQDNLMDPDEVQDAIDSLYYVYLPESSTGRTTHYYKADSF